MLTARHHRLYGSQWERAIFDPPHSSETPQPIFMKLKIYNYLPDTTPHTQNFRELCWWFWQIASYLHDSFLCFFSEAIFGHRTHNMSLDYVLAKLGGQKHEI